MTSRRRFIRQSGLAAASLVASSAPLPTFAHAEDNRYRQLREAIAAQAKLLKIPGLVAAVVEDGRVAFVQTEGFSNLENKTPMPRDHIFPIASVTKTFAAVTLMQYEQEGKMSMDDYVLDYPFLSIGFTPERLQTPNIKIKDVLSHTSEGEPGSNYIYNGGRYNFVYGAFEAISGNTKHYEAFASEVKKRILQPLKMNDTLPGYPTDKNSPAIPRIVTTYNFHREQQVFQPDKGISNWMILYPSTNLLSTVDDLASYCLALDNNTILTAESYKKLTTPFVSPDGHAFPYGLGWATQRVNGRSVHWHYGYGDSYAALMVRVPEEKLSFILLSNATPASEAFVLGYGNVLNSVFAHSFFKHIVYKRSGQFSYEALLSNRSAKLDALDYDEIFSQALMRHFAEQTYKEHKGEATALMRYLVTHDAARFQQPDISLIYLLRQLEDPQFKAPMENLIAAYASSKYFHPHIHEQIADWYERNGHEQSAREWYHQLADSNDYGEQGAVRKACRVLGKYYMAKGEKEKGRTYLWKEALYNRYGGSGTDVVDRQLALMKQG